MQREDYQKLRKCPFCGGEVVEGYFMQHDALLCDKCGIVIILPQSGVGNKKLVKIFNTRTPEIVRCGECEEYEAYDNYCKYGSTHTCSDWFCRYGERREEK